MMIRSRALRSPAALFTLIALSIAIVEIAIVRSAVFARNRDIAAWGVTFDLTITIPLLYHGLFSWRAQPDVPAGAIGITTHKRSGWGTVVVCFIVLIAFESVGLHLLVQHWSVKWDWIFT